MADASQQARRKGGNRPRSTNSQGAAEAGTRSLEAVVRARRGLFRGY